MALLVFEHHDDETPCILGRVLHSHGHVLRTVGLHKGEAVPADLDDVDGIVTMGGPMNLDEAGSHLWMDAEMAYLRNAHNTGLPIVGICLGAQLIASALGGEVAAMDEPEVGFGLVHQSFHGTVDPVLAGIPWRSMQFHLHGQEVRQLPSDSRCLASSDRCKVQAFCAGLCTYGFQYHFEWDEANIKGFARDVIVENTGSSAEQIIHSLQEHFSSYRRLGDRLCRLIAELIFPIEKRRVPLLVSSDFH